jgi:hypothetical protein
LLQKSIFEYIKLTQLQTAFYIAWIFIHFSILLINGSNSYHSDKFFPFARLSQYDISEFIIYSLLPIIVIAIFRLIKKDREIKSRTKEYETKLSKIILDGDMNLTRDRILQLLNDIPRNIFSEKAWSHIAYKAKSYSILSQEIKREDNKDNYKIYLRKITLFGRLFGNTFPRIALIVSIGAAITIYSENISSIVVVIAIMLLGSFYFVCSYYFND